MYAALLYHFFSPSNVIQLNLVSRHPELILRTQTSQIFFISLSPSSLRPAARILSCLHRFLLSCPHVYHAGQCVCMHMCRSKGTGEHHTHMWRKRGVEDRCRVYSGLCDNMGQVMSRQGARCSGDADRERKVRQCKENERLRMNTGHSVL